MINFKQMMQQAQQMQFKLQELQEKMKDIDVEGTAANGMVRVVMNCVGILRKVDIDASLINADDKETLEDLIVAATNNAYNAKEERIKTETEAMMSAMGLPKDAKLPFS